MSTQRRRVFESDEGITTIPNHGVYIEGINGKFYTVDNWKGGSVANSVIVANGNVKFRIALTEERKMMNGKYNAPLENYMTGTTSETVAMTDYNGAGNTANILKATILSTYYAASYCDSFVFPDGKTKGFLPSLGQWKLVYRNKAAVNAALSKCGGTAMSTSNSYYWSSTFWGVNSDSRQLWVFNLGDYAGQGNLTSTHYTRPFADLN